MFEKDTANPALFSLLRIWDEYSLVYLFGLALHC